VRAPAGDAAADLRVTATPIVPEGDARELQLAVLDAATGRPVAAFFATLLPEGRHVQGREGVARFPGLAAGTHTIEVQGPEHEPALTAADVPAKGPVEVRLTQRRGLRGVVRLADARAAPDVVLRILATTAVGADAESAAAQVQATRTLAKTDVDGHYRFAPLPPGRYSVFAEHHGTVLRTLGPFEVTEGMTDVPEIRLEAGARLELEVTDLAGQPAENVLLVIVPATGSTLRRYSGSDGKLVLEPLAPGRYTVNLPAQENRAAQQRELELTLGLHHEVFQVDTSTPAGR
jgi:hypothetical protein